MNRMHPSGFKPVYQDATVTLLAPLKGEADGHAATATRKAIIIAHSDVDAVELFTLPAGVREIRHLAPKGYRLFSSPALFGQLEGIRGFETAVSGQQYEEIRLAPFDFDAGDLELGQTIDRTGQSDPGYHLIVVNQPMALSELLNHSKVAAFYSHFDLHVCRCEPHTGPMYFLDVPSIPAQDLKLIQWQVFGRGRNGRGVSNDTGEVIQGGEEYVEYANRYIGELSSALSYYRDPSNTKTIDDSTYQRLATLQREADGQLHHFAEEIAVGRQTGIFEPDFIKRITAFKDSLAQKTGGDDISRLMLKAMELEEESALLALFKEGAYQKLNQPEQTIVGLSQAKASTICMNIAGEGFLQQESKRFYQRQLSKQNLAT